MSAYADWHLLPEKYRESVARMRALEEARLLLGVSESFPEDALLSGAITESVRAVRLGGLAGTDTLIAGEPAALLVAPTERLSVPVGGIGTVDARIVDYLGELATSGSLSYSITNGALATIDPVTAVVSGLAAGTTILTVTASWSTGDTVQSQDVVLTLDVYGPAASIAVSPSPVPVEQGFATVVTATIYDAAGVRVPGQTVTWSTTSGAIATVNIGGEVSGVAIGSTTVTATLGLLTGTATVNVTGPLAIVTISPDPVTLTDGQSQALSAATTDSLGNPISGVTKTWSSSDSSIASVNASTGVVTAGTKRGTATITCQATKDGITVSDTSSVTADLTILFKAVAGTTDPGWVSSRNFNGTYRDALGVTQTAANQTVLRISYYDGEPFWQTEPYGVGQIASGSGFSEHLYAPIQNPPTVPMTVLYEYVLTSAVLATTNFEGIASIGARVEEGGGNALALLGAPNESYTIGAYWENAGTTQGHSMTVGTFGVAPSVGVRVTFRVTIQPKTGVPGTSQKTTYVSYNGGAETASATTDIPDPTGAWSVYSTNPTARVWFGGTPIKVCPPVALRRLVVAYGVKTLAQMRAL